MAENRRRSIHLTELLVFLAMPLYPATLTVTGPSSVKAGSTVTLTLSAVGTADNTGGAAFQWSMAIPAGYTATVIPGSAASSSDKTLTCSVDNSTCVLAGMNITPINNGPLAIYTVKIPLTAASRATFSLAGLAAATPQAAPLSATSGPTYSLNIADLRDLNGDGVVNAMDVQLMAMQAVSSQSTPASCVDDQNGDGKCDVVDVLLVVLRALNLI